MKKNFLRIFCLALALIMTALCCACSEHGETPEPEPEPDVAELSVIDASMTELAFVGYGVASFKDAETGNYNPTTNQAIIHCISLTDTFLSALT